jgi:uncharacterized protein (TIGR02246 family)
MAAVGADPALSFRETLQRHLDALQNRDLGALADTVAEDALILIGADGRLTRSAREFLDAHRGWFEMRHWTLHATPLEVREGADVAFAVLHLLYCEDAPGKPALRQQSHLTLVFACEDGRWRMVLDQNTPLKE